MNCKPLALAALLGLAGTCAQAGVNVNLGIGLPGVVYVEPAPVYAPPPPPVYVMPRPVYAPRPVVVMPQPMYAPRWREDDDDRDEWKHWRKHQEKEQKRAYKRWRREQGDDD